MADDISKLRDELSSQISTLKKEVAKLNHDVAHRAQHMVDDGREQAQKAAHQIGHQAKLTAELARRNPRTAASVLLGAGLIGAMIGLAASAVFSDHDH